MSEVIPTSLRLDPKLKAKLKVEAEKRRWGVSELIQEILKGWLKRREGKEL